MQINDQRTRQYLKEFNFQTLFNVGGWDHCTHTLNVEVGETEYFLTAAAEKRDIVVFECRTTKAGEPMPNYPTRRKIHQQVAKSVYKHLIIYTDFEKTTQIWQWAKHEPGKPIVYREQRYELGQSGQLLIQKLQTIVFTLEQEPDITHLDVIEQVQAAFDVEPVTRRFYDHFKKEHTAFLKFLNGIPDEEMQKWYASVMLNRLMFIYFIQKKSFLDSDQNYLSTKLTESQEMGKDQYYKNFLCPLFFEGFAKPEAERSIDNAHRLLGKIPYLNGGIFQKHQIEILHGKAIQIPDTAFEKIFGFFNHYDWHLDDRPLQSDNEINPDVLGYIFEKYINQKQMGAYYTKEDITEYISKNTIIPSLFDTVKNACKTVFESETAVLELLQDNPNRYIYKPMKNGVKLELPPNIAMGISDASKRTDWNTLAPNGDDEYALPTETWREVIARRQRYEMVHTKLSDGEINDINDLITYNLDIILFAQDVIENCEGPELLRAFWKAITEVTVLDPTCGSGAFLFAALNILKPLYKACLDRMQVFLDEAGAIPELQQSPKYNNFREILGRIAQHPNQEYFVLKSIIINNLYGVDIMEEAVEICKLRLFLKMVAQIEDAKRIEPLPDIDFNIQVGNALVGYTSYNEVKDAIESKLNFDDTMERIEEKAKEIEQQFEQFRLQQTEHDGSIPLVEKQDLQNTFQVLEDELNEYLAGEYQINPSKKSDYQNWLASHKPFHWFMKFYGILQNGGFDIIIGNPPYVEYSKVKKDYAIKDYETGSCGNLYAFVMERSMVLKKDGGRCGMIVPLSGHSTDRMKPLIADFYRKAQLLHIMNISGDAHPSVLFPGVKFRLAIFLSTTQQNKGLYTTKYSKWFSEERENLFQLIEYVSVNQQSQNFIHKLSTRVHSDIIEKLLKHKGSLALHQGKHTTYYHNAPVHWIRAHSFIPYFHSERDGEKISTI